MANDIAMTCPDLVDNGCERRTCVECLANGMTDLGYRKASEVAREIFEEVGKIINEYLDGRSYRHEFLTKIAELKNKYTEGEDV